MGTTDENGVASLTFDEAGRYTLSAVRKSSWYDSKNNPAIDISRPYAELTVTEVTYTDAEAVAKAKGELDPVSYTHLDVYKRQPGCSRTWGRSPSAAAPPLKRALFWS